MIDTDLRGPALTYVTDTDLDQTGQQRVLQDFISCAGVHPLRVAFRLPTWSDSDYLQLVDWYFEQIAGLGATAMIEPPLVHDRPEVVEQFPESMLWLPWRNRDLIATDDIGRVAVSVHSVKDAHEAISLGASELVFGHVFSSESHPGQPGRGIVALQDVVESVEVYQNPPRVTAIGGIDGHTIPEIGGSRHHSVACMRAISESDDIARSIDRLRSGWVAARINADLDESQRAPFGNPSSIFF